MKKSSLGEELEQMIRIEGPMPLDRFMALCLGHPVHGYYMSADRFGVKGDFITAPEVSQMFGEILGVWCVSCFEAMGRPPSLSLVELGPGRGTLMADILRAAKVAPDFLRAVSVELVETSPAMREAQRQSLQVQEVQISWHTRIEDVAERPALFIANEFFDALPVRQLQKTEQGWAERSVGLRDGKLSIGLIPCTPTLPAWTASLRIGEIAEISPAGLNIAHMISGRLARSPGAALIVDYGHVRSRPGGTLQSVRDHRPVDILSEPGESDLTAHVDFQALGSMLSSGGAQVFSPMTQRDFLLGMGLELRAQQLARIASETERREILAALDRLAGPDQMGNHFKMIAAASRDIPAPHPFKGAFP